MEFSIKKFIKDLTINSLYYRTEIVCGIAGFIGRKKVQISMLLSCQKKRMIPAQMAAEPKEAREELLMPL